MSGVYTAYTKPGLDFLDFELLHDGMLRNLVLKFALVFSPQKLETLFVMTRLALGFRVAKAESMAAFTRGSQLEMNILSISQLGELNLCDCTKM